MSLKLSFEAIMYGYEERFGEYGADAFRKAVRAGYAGVEVITEEPPSVPPLECSVQAGVFGKEDDGSPVIPRAEEVQAITEMVSERLLGVDADERQNILSLYSEDFGELAACQLHSWAELKKIADSGSDDEYDPAHPFHYYSPADGGKPMPLDHIPPAQVTGPAGRGQPEALCHELAVEERQLSIAQKRYTELAEKGDAAVSLVDRRIANTEDAELAWASAIALKYIQIRKSSGRVQWLRGQLVKGRA
jgi:hypothetical protein